MDPDTSGDVTRLLACIDGENPDAWGKVLPLVYEELHTLAERSLRGERPDHTLQPTALINEAFLRLASQHDFSWHSRTHFVAVAATMMRRILVDHARAHRAQKRGGQQSRIELNETIQADAGKSLDLESLDEALRKLSALDLQQGRIVEMRFFGGLTVEETAGLLGISPATVKREWNSARAWLKRQMQ
jgi:RNA polymerase sigma-70 factor (ECF subfamily)